MKLAEDAFYEFQHGERPGVIPNSALFYHTTAVAPKWSHTFRRVAAIGSHVFYSREPDGQLLPDRAVTTQPHSRKRDDPDLCRRHRETRTPSPDDRTEKPQVSLLRHRATRPQGDGSAGGRKQRPPSCPGGAVFIEVRAAIGRAVCSSNLRKFVGEQVQRA